MAYNNYKDKSNMKNDYKDSYMMKGKQGYQHHVNMMDGKKLLEGMAKEYMAGGEGYYEHYDSKGHHRNYPFHGYRD